MEEKIDKLYKLVIVAIVLAGIAFVFTIGGLFKTTGSNTNNNNETEESTEFDVSSFNTLTLSKVLDLFNDKKGTYVVNFGRPTCSVCVKFLPTLKAMQTKYNYTTQYLDITTVKSGTDEYEKLMKKLSKKVTLTVNGEEKTQEFGKFFGYTPMTFIIKNGKFVDGIVGNSTEANFEKFLNKNGIK